MMRPLMLLEGTIAGVDAGLGQALVPAFWRSTGSSMYSAISLNASDS
jgi:hypothetical protein